MCAKRCIYKVGTGNRQKKLEEQCDDDRDDDDDNKDKHVFPLNVSLPNFSQPTLPTALSAKSAGGHYINYLNNIIVQGLVGCIITALACTFLYLPCIDALRSWRHFFWNKKSFAKRNARAEAMNKANDRRCFIPQIFSILYQFAVYLVTMVSIVFVEKNGEVEAFKMVTGAIMVEKEYMQGMCPAFAQPFVPTQEELKKLTNKSLEELLKKGLVAMPKCPTKQWLVEQVMSEWKIIKETVNADLRRAKRSQQAKELRADFIQKKWQGVVQKLRANAMKDYITDFKKGKEVEAESIADVSACDGEEGAEEEVHTDDLSVSDATEPEEEESEEEEEVKEKKIQHMSVWTCASEGWLKGLQEINSTRATKLKLNPREERALQEKKNKWETSFLPMMGNGLVILKKNISDDGVAFVLDIESNTVEDFMKMIASPLGNKAIEMTLSVAKLMHKNKKAEKFRRLTEYVKGATSLDDCTFYLQPLLSGGAKRPASNDTKDVKMARLVARLKTDARAVEATEVDAFVLCLQELSQHLTRDYKIQELIAKSELDALTECKNLVDRNNGGRMAQTRIESIAKHLIPELDTITECFDIAKELYNHLFEKFNLAYAKEFNHEHGGQLRVNHSAFFDAVDGAIKLKDAQAVQEKVQKEKTEKDATISKVMGETHAMAERLAQQKFQEFVQKHQSSLSLQSGGVPSDVNMEG